MRVGVKETVLQQLLQAAVHPHLHHVVGVHTDPPHGLEVGEFHPIDPFHREHAPAGGFMEDARYGDAGIVAVQFGEFFRVGRFIEVVHLLEHPLTEFIDQRHQITADQTHVAVEPGGDIAHDVEIERDLLAQTRSLHLHRHLLTALQHAAVHLAQGGG